MSDGYGQQWSSGEPAAPPAEEEQEEPSWGEQAEAAWDEFTDQVEETWDAAVETVQDAWAKVTDGDGYADGGVPPDAGADLRIKSDFELQVLAADPGDAAAAWPSMTEPERRS